MAGLPGPRQIASSPGRAPRNDTAIDEPLLRSIPEARPRHPRRARGSALSREATVRIVPFVAGAAGLLEACSPYSDTAPRGPSGKASFRKFCGGNKGLTVTKIAPKGVSGSTSRGCSCCGRCADGRGSASHTDAVPPRPACARRTASAPRARRGYGRCTRANGPPKHARLRCDTDVLRLTLRIDERRWSRCGCERSCVVRVRALYAARRRDQAKRLTKARAQPGPARLSESPRAKKNVRVAPSTRYPRNINSFSTAPRRATTITNAVRFGPIA